MCATQAVLIADWCPSGRIPEATSNASSTRSRALPTRSGSGARPCNGSARVSPAMAPQPTEQSSYGPAASCRLGDLDL